MSEKVSKDLGWYLTDMSSEKLRVLLEQIMECVLFTLNQGQGDYASFTHGYANVSSFSEYISDVLHTDC